MLKSFKYRIYPNIDQQIQLAKTFGCVRFVYNQLLAKRIDLYKTEGKTLYKIDCNNYCNRELKIQYPWLKDVDKFALTNSIYNLDKAFQNFFTSIKNGSDNKGFPKFKSKHNNHYSYTTSFTKNNIEIKENKIKLPKLRWVKLAKSREIQGRILNCTITRTCSGKYFVSICCTDVEVEKFKNNKNIVGLDLGLKEFAITSYGEIIDNPKYFSKLESNLKKQQRKLSKKKKGSKNRNKARIKLNIVHEKLLINVLIFYKNYLQD